LGQEIRIIGLNSKTNTSFPFLSQMSASCKCIAISNFKHEGTKPCTVEWL